MKLIYAFLLLASSTMNWATQVESVASVWVSTYTRADGVVVPGHYRSKADKNVYNNYGTKGNVNPHTGKKGSGVPEGVVWIDGYTRKDGVVIKGHFRTKQDSQKDNNWIADGNVNPSTGKPGWVKIEKAHEEAILTVLADYNNLNGLSLPCNEDSIKRLITEGVLPRCSTALYDLENQVPVCVSKADIEEAIGVTTRRTQLFNALY